MSTSVEYEQVTRAIFQALVDQDQARNISVEHDVELTGKFLSHQCEVYWKFERAGIEYSTVVECKDWSKRLEQEKLMAFRSKLEDLNNPKGVIVTRSGYQSGALKYARAHGILLYELFEQPPRPPLVVTEGSFGTMELTFQAASKGAPPRFVSRWTYFEPHYDNNTYYLDEEWFKEHTKGFSEQRKHDLTQLKLPEQPLSSTKLYDEHRHEIGNMLDVFRKKSQEMMQLKVTSDKFVHRFAHPAFLKTDKEFLPYMKIKGVSTDISISEHEPQRGGQALSDAREIASVESAPAARTKHCR